MSVIESSDQLGLGPYSPSTSSTSPSSWSSSSTGGCSLLDEPRAGISSRLSSESPESMLMGAGYTGYIRKWRTEAIAVNSRGMIEARLEGRQTQQLRKVGKQAWMTRMQVVGLVMESRRVVNVCYWPCCKLPQTREARLPRVRANGWWPYGWSDVCFWPVRWRRCSFFVVVVVVVVAVACSASWRLG